MTLKEKTLRFVLGWLAALMFLGIFVWFILQPETNQGSTPTQITKTAINILVVLSIIAPVSMIFNWFTPIPFTGLMAGFTIWIAVARFIKGDGLPNDTLLAPAFVVWPVVYTIDFIFFWLVPIIRRVRERS